MEIKAVNECLDVSQMLELDAIIDSLAEKASEFDASCYNGDACYSSSG